MYAKIDRRGFGADVVPPDTGAAPSTSISDIADSSFVKTASGVALAYHGYKRTGSLGWALVYALAGRWFPLEAVPIAIAQGFGDPKKGCP